MFEILERLKKWTFVGACLFCAVESSAQDRKFYQKIKAISEEIDTSHFTKALDGILIAKDPTTGFVPLTDELLKEPELSDWKNFDPGFQKWMLLFFDIPGKAPYSIKIKRIASFNPDLFASFKGEKVLTSDQIEGLKKMAAAFAIF